jgi:hypothetical protein
VKEKKEERFSLLVLFGWIFNRRLRLMKIYSFNLLLLLISKLEYKRC